MMKLSMHGSEFGNVEATRGSGEHAEAAHGSGENFRAIHGNNGNERIIYLMELKEIDDFLGRKNGQFDGEKPEMWETFVKLFVEPWLGFIPR